MRRVLASVDLGSDSLKLVVGEYYKGKVNVLAKAWVTSLGIKNGIVTQPEMLVNNLKELLKKGEDILGLPISSVIVTISSLDVRFYMNEGYTTIQNEEEVVRPIDLIRAMQASVYNQIDDEQELATIMPISYMVDEDKVNNPMGMQGHKLTVKTIFTSVPKKNIMMIIKCFEKIGVKVIDTTFGAMGDYFEFKTPKLEQQVGVIINIGSMKTELSVFNKGVLTNIVSLNVGSENIDNDLMYMFKVLKKDAKDIRKNLCFAHKKNASANVKKEYTNKMGEKVIISEYEATLVASSRIEEILKLAKKQINHLTKKEIHYIIITGGISEMTNFKFLVEEIFGQMAKIGSTKEIGLRSNMYSTTMGLIKYYIDKLNLRGQDFSMLNEEEQDELSGISKKISINEDSILGKLFGYFFDN